MKNKKGLKIVVATVSVIILTFLAMGIVWVFLSLNFDNAKKEIKYLQNQTAKEFCESHQGFNYFRGALLESYCYTISGDFIQNYEVIKIKGEFYLKEI